MGKYSTRTVYRNSKTTTTCNLFLMIWARMKQYDDDDDDEVGSHTKVGYFPITASLFF